MRAVRALTDGARGAGMAGSFAVARGAAVALWAAGAPPGLTAQDAVPTYRLYVGAESADLLHRVAFGANGAWVEASIPVGRLYEQSSVPHLYSESEAPHGVAVDRERGVVYMTTGHGLPDGKLWKVEAGTGRLLGGPVDLGRFPASVDVSPDGRWVTVANFNLHGEMSPSSISVVFAGEMVEVARIETCTMPHGSRFHPDGRHHYSVCMMDDQLVEIDLRATEVSRRLLLAAGREGPLPREDRGYHTGAGPAAPGTTDARAAAEGDGADHAGHAPPGPPGREGGARHLPSCSPTWVQPSHDGARLYVACNASDEVLEIQREGWEVVRRFPTGRGPYNLDVTPDDGMLVVTLKQGNAVEFIDLDRGRTASTVPTASTVVHGVALSPDGRFAFVSVEGVGNEPGQVEVYEIASFQRVSRAPLGQQSSGISFWRQDP